MFKSCFILVVLSCLNIACSKEGSSEVNGIPESGFVKYTIPAGKHYSVDTFKLNLIQGLTELNFKFKFDSTAIYKTVDPSNQGDHNKLYGFADGVSFTTVYTIPPHHVNSARIGWHWSNNALHVSAYYYNDSAQLFKDLQTVTIGKTYTAKPIVGKKEAPTSYYTNLRWKFNKLIAANTKINASYEVQVK